MPWYVPATHDEHADEPAVPANLPARQLRQAVELVAVPVGW